jgi:hypothetical protein
MGPAQVSHEKSPLQPVFWLRREPDQFPAYLQGAYGENNICSGTDHRSMTSGSRSKRPTESSGAR